MVIIGLMSFMGTATAQDNEAKQTSYKIGVFDRKVVLDGYKKVENEYNKLQEEVDERQKEITKLSERIEADTKEYEKIKDTLTAEEQAEREAEIESDYREYKAKLSTQQAEIDDKERLLMKKIFAEIDEAVENVGKEQNYHLILESGARAGVIWHSPTIDISQKVVGVLNGAK